MESKIILENGEIKKVLSTAHELISPEEMAAFDIAVETTLETANIVTLNGAGERSSIAEKASEVQFAAGVILGAATALLITRKINGPGG